MSKSFGLCRFRSTSNIYWCVYDGTSDVMYPWLYTDEEITDDNGGTHLFSMINSKRPWKPEQPPTDIDVVDLYSDYGGGFYWRGTGSESNRMILNNLMPFDECWEGTSDGKPDWVRIFLKEDK